MNQSVLQILILPTCAAVLVGLAIGFVAFRLIESIGGLIAWIDGDESSTNTAEAQGVYDGACSENAPPRRNPQNRQSKFTESSTYFVKQGASATSSQ
jgi:hypothetical protein